MKKVLSFVAVLVMLAIAPVFGACGAGESDEDSIFFPKSGSYEYSDFTPINVRFEYTQTASPLNRQPYKLYVDGALVDSGNLLIGNFYVQPHLRGWDASDGKFKVSFTDSMAKIYDIEDAEILAALKGLTVVLLARE